MIRQAAGKVIRQNRKIQRKTLRDLAAAAGISFSHLSEVETAKKDVSSEVLASISDALGIKPATLLRMIAAQLESENA